MIVHPTTLPEVLLLEPAVDRDERGVFLEAFNEERFRQHGIELPVRQLSHARSTRGVLRGLHFQEPFAQGKLVTVTRGAIFDVAVDVRLGSPRFGHWAGVTLSGEDPRALWIPRGFAHGYCVLSDDCDMMYALSEVYHPEAEHGVHWADPRIGIEWPIDDPVIAARDATFPPLSDSRTDLPSYHP
jgi:dTDP-4-dehydrorhamnose 3,5-epimerase